MKKLCSVLLALVFIVLEIGLNVSAEASDSAKETKIKPKVELYNKPTTTYFTRRDRKYKRYYLGQRTALSKRLEDGSITVDSVLPDAPYSGPPTIPMMEEKATAIVLGSFSNDMTSEQSANINESMSGGVTSSAFKIDKVFKGDLQAGETIPIVEEFHIVDYGSGKVLKSVSQYLPSLANTQYLLFLGIIPERSNLIPGAYTLAYKDATQIYSRFPVLTKEQQERGFYNLTAHEFSMTYFSSEYKAFYPEVAEKYGFPYVPEKYVHKEEPTAIITPGAVTKEKITVG